MCMHIYVLFVYIYSYLCISSRICNIILFYVRYAWYRFFIKSTPAISQQTINPEEMKRRWSSICKISNMLSYTYVCMYFIYWNVEPHVRVHYEATRNTACNQITSSRMENKCEDKCMQLGSGCVNIRRENKKEQQCNETAINEHKRGRIEGRL